MSPGRRHPKEPQDLNCYVISHMAQSLNLIHIEQCVNVCSPNRQSSCHRRYHRGVRQETSFYLIHMLSYAERTGAQLLFYFIKSVRRHATEPLTDGPLEGRISSHPYAIQPAQREFVKPTISELVHSAILASNPFRTPWVSFTKALLLSLASVSPSVSTASS